jgi:putative solute:sodium symporter small subunit
MSKGGERGKKGIGAYRPDQRGGTSGKTLLEKLRRRFFMTVKRDFQAYWRTNLFYVAVLLGIWFFVSYLCGIMISDTLDQFKFFGFPLGFWFANQGSLVTFVILIAVYVKLMNSLDERHDVHEK